MNISLKGLVNLLSLTGILLVGESKTQAYYANLPRDYQTAIDRQILHSNTHYLAHSATCSQTGDVIDNTGNLGDYLYYNNQISEIQELYTNTGRIYFQYYLWSAYLDPTNFYVYWEAANDYLTYYSNLAAYREDYNSTTMQNDFVSNSQTVVDLLYARQAAAYAYVAESDFNQVDYYEASFYCEDSEYTISVDDWYDLAVYEYNLWAYYGSYNYAIASYYEFLGEYCSRIASSYYNRQVSAYYLDQAATIAAGGTWSLTGDELNAGGIYDAETVREIYLPYSSFCSAYSAYYASLANYYGS